MVLKLSVFLVCSFLSTVGLAQSPFYEFTVIAEDGEDGIAGIEPDVSVNETGQVAFIARKDDAEQVFVGDEKGIVNVSRSPAGRNFDYPMINNQGKVVSRVLLSGQSQVDLWNVRNPGENQVIATSTRATFSQVTVPVLGDTASAEQQPLVGFLGRVSDLPFGWWANDSGQRSIQESVFNYGDVLASFRAMSAGSPHRRFVVNVALRNENSPAGRIVVYHDPEYVTAWDTTMLASGQSGSGDEYWENLGKAPSISVSGRAVAFSGNRITRLPNGDNRDDIGIFLATSDSGFLGDHDLYHIASPMTVLGYDSEANPIHFETIAFYDDFETTNRIGVIHDQLGPTGLDGDAITVVFVAKPVRASRINPIGGKPLLFSEQRGIWAQRIDINRQFGSPKSLVIHPTTPLPVIQVGDSIGGAIVEDFTLYDPVASPKALAGFPRRGDHYLVFSVKTDKGTKVVRAARLDTDGDGLLDHWETTGVDIDRDLKPDLHLPRFGADPGRKDIFVEIDWLNDRRSGGYVPWSNAPAPGVTGRVARMFADSPVKNVDGSTGVTLHIDAGPSLDAMGEPYSVNMAHPSLWDGGQEISPRTAPSEHLDVVYFGPPGSSAISGAYSRSIHDIKDYHFGGKDNWARELAFKYVLMVDTMNFFPKANGVPWSGRVDVANEDWIVGSFATGEENFLRGHLVKILEGRGAGQIRRIASSKDGEIEVERSFAVVPDSTSTFAPLRGSSGRAEVEFWRAPDFHSQPANDFVVSLGGFGVNAGGWLSTGTIQWRTLAHELGHTLGLRHGGIDHNAYKGDDYLSIMSYSWQLSEGGEVISYSDASDPTFDDWSNVKYDFHTTGQYVGNTFSKSPNQTAGNVSAPFEDDPIDNDPNIYDYEELNGEPIDLTLPLVAVTSPAPGVTIADGGNVTVDFTAIDERGIASARVRVDRNGDGVWTGEGETVDATHQGGGRYRATVYNIGGIGGLRKIQAIAVDPSGNQGWADVPISSGATANVIHQSTGRFEGQSASGQRKVIASPVFNVPGSGRLVITVTSSPPVRQAGQTTNRHDATVEAIDFDPDRSPSSDSTARQPAVPVCNVPGSGPAICASYWQSPSAGQMRVMITGPAIFDPSGEFQGHAAQNYSLSVAFEAVDYTPPQTEILSPAEGDFVETGAGFIVDASCTDDYEVAAIAASFDLNGDGDVTDAGEETTGTKTGGDTYQLTFSNVTGLEGERALNVTATDTSGNETVTTQSVEVRLPDTTGPDLAIQSPQPGWPVEQGQSVSVEVYARDNIELLEVVVSLDLNGDGDVEAPSESVFAQQSGTNLYVAEFENLTGENGARIITAMAQDTAGNISQVTMPITVGGVEPLTELIARDDSGHIDAQSSVWSGGMQQVVDYEPIAIPGSGTVTFRVTATPPVRSENQNISRADPYVRDITFNGVAHQLRATCNAFGSDPAICETSFAAEEAGEMDFAVLGPGQWNIWGEFSGHGDQDYTLEIEFTSVDINSPEITISAPQIGQNLSLGTPLTVDLTATDAVEVASVVTLFDLNGDGDTVDFGEQILAAKRAGDDYRAAFGAVVGPPGTRTIEVLATDTSFNVSRRTVTVGVDGVGAGQQVLFTDSGVIPSQPSDINGGLRQTLTFAPIAIPGMGRLTMRVTSTPNVRQAVQNISREDPQIRQINFNGEVISVTPECNAYGSNPAVCTSTWDAPGAGTLDFDILGPGVWNIWGEFSGHPEQHYTLEVLFLPGPSVTQVSPNTGSIGGRTSVTIRGEGFAYNSVVLFGEIPATRVERISATEIRCETPPGVVGLVDVRVLSPDLEGQPWNYGGPYGLFGESKNGYRYAANPAPVPLQAERLLTTRKGSFDPVAKDGVRQSATGSVTIPGAGQLRFETYAFVPILNAISGPFEDPDNLDWHNESSSVRRFTDASGTNHYPTVDCSDLRFPYGAVICDATRVVSASAQGAGEFTVQGPARWNAFWRQFGEYVMESTSGQHWCTAVWFAEQPTLSAILPNSGPLAGGTSVTIRGTHFAEGTRVLMGGIPATGVTVVNDSTLTCTTPASVKGGATDVSIQLLTMSATLPNAFTYPSSLNPDADDDGDGLSNRIEQFMALDPKVADADAAYGAYTQEGKLHFVYRRSRAPGNLTGTAEWSPNLEDWYNNAITEEVVRDNPGEEYIMLEATIGIDNDAVYVRLRVTE